ncbi:MAG: carbohydrate ABC transporter permease [Treponema sp.]|nr:carbohydrate ABC transporter permease [Treponema sp.]
MKKIKASMQDRVFNVCNTIILSFLLLIVLYPLYFVVIASISNPDAVNASKVIFYPVQPTLEGYTKLLQESRLWIGYRNTILYAVFGTSLNLILTLLTAYPLSRDDLKGGNIILAYFVFTMFFNGGLIATFILVRGLGLYNTPIVLVILSGLNVYNLIVTRTFFRNTIPKELLDAAFMDGCSNWKFFIRIVLPLSKAIIAVMIVFYGVFHWNQYFNALIFISDRNLQPLQMVLRSILIQNTMVGRQVVDENMMREIMDQERYAELIKYGVIIVSSLPVLVLYQFAQKYFVKGVMIGSIKG